MGDNVVSMAEHIWIWTFVLCCVIWVVMVLAAVMNNHTHTPPPHQEHFQSESPVDGLTTVQPPNASQALARLYAIVQSVYCQC